MHGHTQRIISSSLSREQTGHDVPRWMPFRACNSLLRSFQPHLACTQVVCSHLVQECGGGPTVGSTSSVSSRRRSSSPYTGCHTAFKLRLLEMKAWSVTGVCQEPQWYSQTAGFGLFPWTQYGRADTRAPSARHTGSQEGAFYEGISLFTQENGSILLYVVKLLI